MHLFGSCAYTRIAWGQSRWNVCNTMPATYCNVHQLIDFICNPPHFPLNKKEKFSIFGAALLYSLWNERTKTLFSDHPTSLFSFSDELNKVFEKHCNCDPSQSVKLSMLSLDPMCKPTGSRRDTRQVPSSCNCNRFLHG